MFRLWFLLLAPDFPAAFLSMSQQSWPSWSSAGSSYGARSQHATAGIDRYTTLSLISPANGDSHRHLPTPTDDEGSVGDDDLDDLPSAGPENTDYVPDGASVEAKSATKKQRKRRSGKACDHCRKCRTKCMHTNVQEPCRRCLKLDIRKFFIYLRIFILLSCVFLVLSCLVGLAVLHNAEFRSSLGGHLRHFRLHLCRGADLTLPARLSFPFPCVYVYDVLS